MKFHQRKCRSSPHQYPDLSLDGVTVKSISHDVTIMTSQSHDVIIGAVWYDVIADVMTSSLGSHVNRCGCTVLSHIWSGHRGISGEIVELQNVGQDVMVLPKFYITQDHVVSIIIYD